MLAERPGPDGTRDEAAVEAGSIISAAAFLSGTRTTAAVRAARRCRLLALGNAELEALLVSHLGLKDQLGLELAMRSKDRRQCRRNIVVVPNNGSAGRPLTH